MLAGWSILVLALSILGATALAYAQYGSSNSTATPEQLQECKKLGIEPEQCSDYTILAKSRCLGPNCGGNTPPPKLDTITLSTMIGSGIALGVGIFVVRKIRKVRKEERGYTG